MPTSTDPQGTCECCLTPADRCRRTTGVRVLRSVRRHEGRHPPARLR